MRAQISLTLNSTFTVDDGDRATGGGKSVVWGLFGPLAAPGGGSVRTQRGCAVCACVPLGVQVLRLGSMVCA